MKSTNCLQSSNEPTDVCFKWLDGRDDKLHKATKEFVGGVYVYKLSDGSIVDKGDIDFHICPPCTAVTGCPDEPLPVTIEGSVPVEIDHAVFHLVSSTAFTLPTICAKLPSGDEVQLTIAIILNDEGEEERRAYKLDGTRYIGEFEVITGLDCGNCD